MISFEQFLALTAPILLPRRMKLIVVIVENTSKFPYHVLKHLVASLRKAFFSCVGC